MPLTSKPRVTAQHHPGARALAERRTEQGKGNLILNWFPLCLPPFPEPTPHLFEFTPVPIHGLVCGFHDRDEDQG